MNHSEQNSEALEKHGPASITFTPVPKSMRGHVLSAAHRALSPILHLTYFLVIHKQLIKFPITVRMNEINENINLFSENESTKVYQSTEMFPTTLRIYLDFI